MSVNNQPQATFDAAYKRICEVCNVRTQVELADYFGIRQSSISDAKRRSSVPAAWLLAVLMRNRVNPDWILTGEDTKYLVPSPLPPSPEVDLLARLSSPELEQRISHGLEETVERIAEEVRTMAERGKRLHKECTSPA